MPPKAQVRRQVTPGLTWEHEGAVWRVARVEFDEEFECQVAYYWSVSDYGDDQPD